MSRKRLVTTVGGTLACALGIGFFMQRGDSATPRVLMTPLPAFVQQAVMVPNWFADGNETASLDLQNVVLTSASHTHTLPSPLRAPVLETFWEPAAPVASGSAPDAPKDPEMPRLGCEIAATAAPAPMASVDLKLSAPCLGNQRVTVHHNGMMFTTATDTDGRLAVNVPALSEHAVFILAFAEEKGVVAVTTVPDLHMYDRVAVQWSGNTDFQIHAREFGAAYGDTGHVWSESATSTTGTGGFVVRLGTASALEPQMAEIYTFPTGASQKAGTVMLTVETEVTSGNCGREISAQALELRGATPLRTRQLTLSMPDCSAKGDFLVLNNLVDDLKIAAK